LTRADITPDVILQREIFKKVSGVENSREVLEKILHNRIELNKSPNEIDNLLNFKDGSTNKIINEVFMQIQSSVSNEISLLRGFVNKIIECEAFKKLRNDNLKSLKDIYKNCLKRLEFKKNFLEYTSKKFKDLV